MRDPRDQLSQRGHFLGLHQLFLRILQIQVRLFKRLMRAFQLAGALAHHVFQVAVQLLELVLTRGQRARHIIKGCAENPHLIGRAYQHALVQIPFGDRLGGVDQVLQRHGDAMSDHERAQDDESGQQNCGASQPPGHGFDRAEDVGLVNAHADGPAERGIADLGESGDLPVARRKLICEAGIAPFDRIGQVLQPKILDQAGVVQVLQIGAQGLQALRAAPIRPVFVPDDRVHVPGVHKTISGREVSFGQVHFHAVQDALDVGPVDDAEPYSDDFLRLRMAHRLRERDVVLLADIFFAVVVQPLDQRRPVPVVMRGLAADGSVEEQLFFGISAYILANQRPRDQRYFKPIERVDRRKLSPVVQNREDVIHFMVDAVIVQQADHGLPLLFTQERIDDGESGRHGRHFLFLTPEHDIDLVGRVLSLVFQGKLDPIFCNLLAAEIIRGEGYAHEREQGQQDHQ